MDAGPTEGPDPFSRALPLPFRLLLELILGFWLWALNLHGFHLLNIDIFTLVRYPIRPDGEESHLHTSTYRLAAILSGMWMFAIVVFWNVTRGDAELVVQYDWIPNVLFFAMMGVLVLPRVGLGKMMFGTRNSQGVVRLFQGLKRCAIGGIAKPKPEKFGDVLLADALTSYSKPISEVFVTFCMFFKGLHTTNKPDRLCAHEAIVPLAIAWPFMIRLSQCLKEGQGANALKYATAFPVIIFSSIARNNPGYQFFWTLAALTNSLYSFWWDISRDWDLTLLSQTYHAQPEKPFGLRQHRIFKLPMIYYVVIVFDLIFRFAWSMKLSLHLVYLDGIEGGIFLLEIMELLRRWVWVYFRVETEYVRNLPATSIDL
ncbi:hypothetical protein DOTSEDRAFT_159559 [Dothistroma septosporum NZE10]|uniref:EXS domain-containing protein n=1 Tax=Dothistroma septosporum (strain NZE10 / CBS 128990) TaxID=675120 RepID=M2Y205_DOTSN|nr:hypothetical protein DOTSEDRAFT_159559 [Dothistroma septosporum NZE10]